MQFGGKDLQVFRSAALCCQKGSRFLFCLVLCCDVESSVLRLFFGLEEENVGVSHHTGGSVGSLGIYRRTFGSCHVEARHLCNICSKCMS